MRVADLANRLEQMGYTHPRPTKRQNQLQQSLNALLQRDAAFVRVARGRYDFADRSVPPNPPG
jgi:hypothetical protein